MAETYTQHPINYDGMCCFDVRYLKCLLVGLVLGLHILSMGVSRGPGGECPPLEFENDDVICYSPVKHLKYT